VLAITSGSKDMGAIMKLVWKHLLPAFSQEPVRDNGEDYANLQRKLQQLALSTPKGQANSPRSKVAQGKTYTLEPNKEGLTAVRFDLGSKTPAIQFTAGNTTYALPMAYGKLLPGNIPQSGSTREPTASAYAWTATDTMQVRSYLSETPYYHQYQVIFSGDSVLIRRNTNVGFDPAAKLELKGVLQKR
jgi:hypothetical protein